MDKLFKKVEEMNNKVLEMMAEIMKYSEYAEVKTIMLNLTTVSKELLSIEHHLIKGEKGEVNGEL